jgi:molecular chaperone IbpA
MISVAVAGFAQADLSVTKDKKVLTIESKQTMGELMDDEQVKYLHKGISERSFRREFQLADHVEITGAHLELGILNIYLKREVPEEAKPKSIAITYQK